MRHLRNLLFFFFGVALVAVPMLSHAETCDGTICTTPATGALQGLRSGFSYYKYQGPLWWFDNVEEACTFATLQMTVATGGATQYTMKAASGQTCYYLWKGQDLGQSFNLGADKSCGANNSAVTTSACITNYSCPDGQGWTLSGSTCTRPDCEFGRDENGACITNPCLALAGTANGLYSGSTYSMKVGYDAAPSGLCVDSCVIAFNKDFGGETWTSGKIGNYTGEACGASGTGDEPAADPENKVNPNTPEKECTDAGKGFGTVNGVVICVNPTAGTPTKKTETEKKTTTTPEGTTTATTTKETTVTKNPDGTTTVTVTITNPDGTTEKTETTTGGTGNGTGGDGGEGDDWGTPTDEGPLPSQSIGPQSITVVDMPTAMNCPNAIVLPHGWGEISYQPACEMAGMIRPITLAFAWLAAGLIVIGGFKDS